MHKLALLVVILGAVGCGASSEGGPDAAGPAQDAGAGDPDSRGPDRPEQLPDAAVDPRFVDGWSSGPGWWLRTLAIRDGNLGWSALVLDSDGHIQVAGGGATIANAQAGFEIYDPIVQGYDLDGVPLRRLGSIDVPGATWVGGLAAGADGKLCLAGGHIAAGLPPSPNADPWARCYDRAGTITSEWLRPAPYGDYASGVAIDATGVVAVAGHSLTPDPYTHGFVASLLPGGQLGWIDDFDDGARGDDLAFSIVAGAHGGFFVAGSSDTSQHPGKIWLRHYGADGRLDLTRALDRYSGEELVATPDGGFLTYLFSADVIAHDASGLERWRYRLPTLPGRAFSASAVAAAPDGTVHVLLFDNGDSSSPGLPILVELDAAGHERRRRNLDMLPWSDFWIASALRVDPAGGLVVAGVHGVPWGEGMVLRLLPAARANP